MMIVRSGKTPHGVKVKQPSGFIVGFDVVLSKGLLRKYSYPDMLKWCDEHIGQWSEDYLLAGGFVWFKSESSAMLFKLKFG